MRGACALLLALAGCHRDHPNQNGAPFFPACPAAAAPLVWPAFHGDGARTGWNQAESELTPDAVAARFGWLWDTPEFDFFQSYAPRVHASPLYFDGLTFPDGQSHRVVVTATSNSWVYAINVCAEPGGLGAGAMVWSRRLTTPAFVPKLDGGLPLGVLSTPIADLRTTPPRLYVTAIDAQAGWQVFALDLTSGEPEPGWPVTVEPTLVEVLDTNGPTVFGRATDLSQRGALALSPDGGLLYFVFGSFDDTSAGWLIAVDTVHPSIVASFSAARTSAAGANGGMWGPGGVAVDDNGSLFVTTGNGPRGPTPGAWGESLLQLTPRLQLAGTYTPWNHCQLDDADIDVGGSSPLLLPPFAPALTATPRLVSFGGKQGTVYLVDRARLPGRLDARPACSADSTSDASLLPPGPQPQFGARGPLDVFGPYSELYGNHDYAKMRSTPAYFEDGQGGRFVFVSGSSKAAADSTMSVPPSLVKLSLALAPGAPAYLAMAGADRELTWINPGSPVVSSNGGATPVVWVVDPNASRLAPTLEFNTPNPFLYAVDGASMRVLYRSPKDQLFVGAKYAAPAVAHGWVFVATNRLQAFGLRP